MLSKARKTVHFEKAEVEADVSVTTSRVTKFGQATKRSRMNCVTRVVTLI